MKKYFLTLFKNHYQKALKKIPKYYLGVWCNDLDQIKKNSKFTLLNPLENEKFQKKSSDYFAKVKKKISPAIYKKLNNIHKTNHAYKYWDFFLGFYLEVIIGIIYQKWILLQKIKRDKKNSFTTNLYRINKEDIAFNSTNEFYSTFLHNGETFHHFIDSLIIENFNICKYKKLNRLLKPKIVKRYCNKNLKLEFLYKLSKSYLKFSKSANNVFLTPINPKFILKTFLKKNKIPIYLKDPNLNYTYNKKFRDWDLDIKSKNQFEEVVIKIISNVLPRSVLEGYKINKNLIEKNYNFKIKNIFFAVGISDLFNILMVEKKLTGSKIINVQHGGNYGSLKRHLDEFYELNSSDYFLSYGFSKKDLNYKISSNIIKLGPLNFEKKIGTTIKKKKYIFILPHFEFRYLQMNSYPWTKQKFYHLNQIINLLNSLDKKVKKISEIRFHPMDQDIILNFMKKKITDFKYFKICKKGKLDFENYNLVLSLYPGTSMVQSLYKNLPTIISFPTDYFKLKENIKKYYKILKKNNIFFEDYIKLADFLNNSKFNPINWWEQKKLQLEVDKFKKLFCFSKNQEKNMEKFITKIN